MKRMKIIILDIAISLILLFSLFKLEMGTPKLFAEGGDLELDAPGVWDELYLLAGEWKVEIYDNIAHATLSVYTKEACRLSLYLAYGNNFLIDGREPEPSVLGDYHIYNFISGAGEKHEIYVESPGSSSFRLKSCVYIGPASAALSLVQKTALQRMFIVGIDFAALLYSLSLFLAKRSERYLLLFALLAMITGIRTGRYASPPLTALIGDAGALPHYVINFKGLSVTANLALDKLYCSLVPIALRYYLIQEFSDGKDGRGFPYIRYLALALPLFITWILLAGGEGLSAKADALFRFAAYIFEYIAIVAKGGNVGSKTLRWAWILSVSLWLFKEISQTAFHFAGSLVTRWGLGGIIETVYLLGFFYAINGRFAAKFSGADRLAVQLEHVNAGLERMVSDKTEELQSSYEALKLAQSRKDRLIRAIAHDLKTPLFSLTGYTDMVKAELPDNAQAALNHVAMIGENIEQIKCMVDNLLLYTRLEDGRISFQRVEFSIREVFEKIQKTYLPQILEKSMDFSILCAENITFVGDDFYFTQAIQNIIDNGIRYVRPGGRMAVAAFPASCELHLSIYNDGPHIPEAELERIFDQYYSTRPPDHGSSGLGLTITKQIIEGHGGRVYARSGEKKGVTFYICLPLREPEDDMRTA